MQTGITPIPGDNQKKPADRIPHTTDKNRIDEIAQTSEEGRTGEGSTYIPPSRLNATEGQEYPDGPSTGTGEYGLDHFLDNDALGSSDRDSASPDGNRDVETNGSANREPMEASRSETSEATNGGASKEPVENASASGRESWPQVSETMNKVEGNARRSWGALSKNMRDRADQVDRNVKSRPYAYVIGALGVGFAIAKLIS